MRKQSGYDIFIDESCHLENDRMPVMGIGYIKVPKDQYVNLRQQIKQLKEKHRTTTELKWAKLSHSRLGFYEDLIRLFFNSSLEFRVIVVEDKKYLDHDQFNQGSHDNFYYKVIYYLLRPNDEPTSHRVFLDIKDTRGRSKLRKIKEVFENQYYGCSPFKYFQHLRSEDNEFIQLADFFIGATVFKARGLDKNSQSSSVKKEVIKKLEKASGYSLDNSTPPFERKFNIFYFQPQKR